MSRLWLTLDNPTPDERREVLVVEGGKETVHGIMDVTTKEIDLDLGPGEAVVVRPVPPSASDAG